MHGACRNLGTRGLVMQALSAVDIAWWDLKARLLDVPLAGLMGRCHREVPIYGSGGFTTLTDIELVEQVHRWQSVGCTAMKVKIGRAWGAQVDRDLARVRRLARARRGGRRGGGYAGWLRAAALAQANHLQVSAHCAPSLHAPVAASIPNLRHVEWFADHARLEPRLVCRVPTRPRRGVAPRRRRAGTRQTSSGQAAQWCIA